MILPPEQKPGTHVKARGTCYGGSEARANDPKVPPRGPAALLRS